MRREGYVLVHIVASKKYLKTGFRKVYGKRSVGRAFERLFIFTTPVFGYLLLATSTVLVCTSNVAPGAELVTVVYV